MIIDWLADIPVMVWFGLTAGLVGVIVIMIIISYKRSHEVDELQKAFGEPYDYPEEDEEEKLGKSHRKRREASSESTGSSSKVKEDLAKAQREKASPEKRDYKEASVKEKNVEPERQKSLKRKRDKDADSTGGSEADPLDEAMLKPEEKKGEWTTESETAAGLEQESAAEPRKRVNGRKVSSTKRTRSGADSSDKKVETKEKADASWATLPTEPLPPRGSRHGKSKRASSGKK